MYAMVESLEAFHVCIESVARSLMTAAVRRTWYRRTGTAVITQIEIHDKIYPTLP
jgi:hypothetical protein